MKYSVLIFRGIYNPVGGSQNTKDIKSNIMTIMVGKVKGIRRTLTGGSHPVWGVDQGHPAGENQGPCCLTLKSWVLPTMWGERGH